MLPLEGEWDREVLEAVSRVLLTKLEKVELDFFVFDGEAVDEVSSSIICRGLSSKLVTVRMVDSLRERSLAPEV